MKSLKVVHIVEGFTGGLVTYMATVLPGLVESGYRVTLIYSAERADPDCKEVIKQLQISGVATIKLPFERKICIRDISIFFKLFSILRNERFDIVHTHCAKAGFLGRFAARITGTKAICHNPHCFVSSRISSRFKARTFIWLERIAALVTNKMVFVSESERMFACDNKIARPTQSEIINNGFAFKEIQFCGIENRVSYPKEDKLYVTFSGRLVKYKNPDLLIKAAVLLKSRDVNFLICGEGPEFENLQKLINDNGLADRVSMTGYVQDMSKVYLCSDIFVICSDAEGQPYALLEAMAHNCACIGVRSDGIIDILEDGQTGLICDKSVSDIAKSIEELIDNCRLRGELAKNAKRYINNYHSLKIQIDSLDRLYGQMLSEVS